MNRACAPRTAPLSCQNVPSRWQGYGDEDRVIPQDTNGEGERWQPRSAEIAGRADAGRLLCRKATGEGAGAHGQDREERGPESGLRSAPAGDRGTDQTTGGGLYPLGPDRPDEEMPGHRGHPEG